jgi:hypothetical protein
MSLYWGRRGDSWEPEGGERREWRDLQPGDLIVLRREVWAVREVRLVPVIDWDEQDRDCYQRRSEGGASEEDWRYRPVYLVIVPAKGGKRRHVKVRPWVNFGLMTYALHPHYPVCVECGEPWPCPEIGITREVRKNSAEMERLASILPGCCWSCGGPVTARQKSIAFEGENLLLPGAPAPVFHLRTGKPYCSSAAVDYDKKWVAAGPGRHPRLYCPGKLIVHVDGRECTEDPFCPGRVSHPSFLDHRGWLEELRRCLRCMDACAQRGITVPESSS